MSEHTAEIAAAIGAALHKHTCSDPETCCWNEDEITPCSHLDNDLSGFAPDIVAGLAQAGFAIVSTRVTPPGEGRAQGGGQ